MSVSRLSALALATVLFLAPASALANAGERVERGDISIEWNGEFDRAHGVRSGSGTHEDPYVISGWKLNNLSIKDTDKAVMIMNNTITGQLRLNYVGHHVHVMGNDIGDLRVNQNNARWGEPMGGPIMNNTITTVGQIRHFDGKFIGNTIGIPAAGTAQDPYPADRAMNLDGFNGGLFKNNTIYGFMDARLHGHHHSSDFRSSGSHAHASHDEMADHTKRYHRATIVGNTIHTSANYALAYVDTNHAANDRTANSETNPYLNAPHVHHTKINLLRNKLVGAGLVVNVFNAQDERHIKLGQGRMNIIGNTVKLPEWDARTPFRTLDGVRVLQARSLRLNIVGNKVTAPKPPIEVDALRSTFVRGSGYQLNTLEDARVIFRGNLATNRQIGLQAMNLSQTVDWTVTRFKTNGVAQKMSYNQENPPNG